MSGFGGGGGFGSSGFGGASGGGGFGDSNPQQGFGGGGFGQSMSQPGSFGGPGTPVASAAAGFGAPSSSPFGATSAPSAAVFGSSPNVMSGGFGGATSSSGFGSAAAPAPSMGGFGAFGASATTSSGGGFGGGNNNMGGGFGASTTSSSGGGFGGGNNSMGGGFGASTTSGGFGSSSGGGGGFGSTAPAPSSGGGFGGGFGASTTTPSGGFGGGGGFATSSSSLNPTFGSAPSSGFGGGAPPSTGGGMAFGSSATVVTSNVGGFGQSSSTKSSSGWNSKPSANPFGTSPASGGFGGGSSSSHADGNMMGSSKSPFHRGGGSSGMAFGRSGSFQPTSSPVPEESDMGDGDDDGDDDDDNNNNNAARRDEEARLKAKIEEKKKLLQAKLEEKKKRLLEKQRQQQAQSPPRPDDEDDRSLSPPPPQHSRKERAFAPPSSSSASSDQAKSLAERNALRFGEQTTDRSKTRDMLPPEMKAQAERAAQRSAPSVEADYSTDHQQKSTVREDLHTAKALVGTCEYFCPDEELLRREREGDIQQLEIPLPGKLHPADWTLRHTAVKRFRRSAADYKLDVPEWVRPPDVLEQVCGYLEEWVMERDRQGPDPRFPQGQTPPPLEVYQFIWDRTRMIRKDFTLQNYVGTGGKCDARAVRCHERIARWHAMCEHQLSHIHEFTTNQSQQNIQELGQTMKTLNQFYDDSLNRSTVEVPDVHGSETRTDLSKFSHGCSTNSVQGKPPLEFDGTDLNNSDSGSNISQRIIGRHAVNSPAHGTAEPEMRGLYILLTMNNEGGMEVLKYAAKLFQERPEVYHSKPVQLALEIFKAKKEYNYARFFSILKSPSTPYLFCCIMFKHVELMRKIAFRIMNKAFGARKKDTGEAIYDAYPLNRLIELLCFEDLDEARASCKHYNITVKQVKVSSSRDEVADVVFWRMSDFKEPTHPEKGFVLPLPPKKMTRIIERKLNGATRLAVCRGEVSGEGATLHSLRAPPGSRTSLSVAPASASLSPEEQARAAELLKKQQIEVARLQREAELKEKEKRRLALEQKKAEDEKLKKEAEKEKAKELEKKRLMQMLEQKRREEEAREAQRLKEEEERQAAEERAQEEARKRAEEAEAKRRADEARRKAEVERLRVEEERRREEAARKERERQQRILEEQRRIEEAKRQERIRQEQEAKRRKEEEERRIAKEWEEKINAARKIVLWKRWKNRVARSIEMTHGAAKSLRQIDPTFVLDQLELGSMLKQARIENPYSDLVKGLPADAPIDMRRSLELCVKDRTSKISLSDLALNEIASSRQSSTSPESEVNDDSRFTLLMKVCVLIPSSDTYNAEPMVELLNCWMNSRLGFGKVSTSQAEIPGKSKSIEARSFIQFCMNAEDCGDCDVALVVIPPPWSTSKERRRALQSITSLLDDSIPRVALVLGDFDHEGHEYMKSVVAESLGSTMFPLPIICNRSVAPLAIDKALESSCKKLASIFVNDVCVKVDRLSIPKLASVAVSKMLWNQLAPQSAADGNVVLEDARSAITSMIELCDVLAQEKEALWSAWPPPAFTTANGVEGYFSKGANLPVDWKSSLRKDKLEKELVWMRHRLTGSFHGVIESLLFEAPEFVREECSVLFTRGSYRRCLQTAMEWFAGHADESGPRYVYFPTGFLDLVFDEMMTLEGGKGADENDAVPVLLVAKDHTIYEAAESGDEIDMEQALLDLARPVGTTHPLLPSSRNTSKRSRPESLSPEKAPLGSPRWASPGAIGENSKKARSSIDGPKNKDLADSSAFSKKLEHLMNGGTVDLMVGDHYLSSIMRHVPKLAMD